jgi:hypothetical protein
VSHNALFNGIYLFFSKKAKKHAYLISKKALKTAKKQLSMQHAFLLGRTL